MMLMVWQAQRKQYVDVEQKTHQLALGSSSRYLATISSVTTGALGGGWNTGKPLFDGWTATSRPRRIISDTAAPTEIPFSRARTLAIANRWSSRSNVVRT